MKIDVRVTAWDEGEAEYLKQDIIEEAARQILNEVMRNADHYGRSFKDSLREEVRRILQEEMSTDFKEEVKQLVAEDMAKRFLRTQQAKELKNQYEINSDALIRSGLKDIISEIVKSEMKKIFK